MPAKGDHDRNRQAKSRWMGLAQLALVLAVVVVAVVLARAPERVERVAPVAGSVQQGGALRPVVNVIQLSPTAESLVFELTGSVSPQRTVRLRSEVTGRLEWVSPKLASGGTFAAGEPIVRVDPAVFELRVDYAAAAVRTAEARVEVARESGEAARRVAEAELAEARVALQLAELDLQRTEISLPFAATVLASGAEVGDLVGSGETAGSGRAAGLANAVGSGDTVEFDDTIAVLYRSGALEVQVPIDPPDLKRLEPVIGRSARVSARTGIWDTDVAGISSVVLSKTHLTGLFLHFREDAPAETLPKPGTFVEVRIEGPVHENVFVLPDSALRGEGSVWIVKSGRLVRFEPRSIGRALGGELVEAFDTGEGVVIGALAGAAEGLAVELTNIAP